MSKPRTLTPRTWAINGGSGPLAVVVAKTSAEARRTFAASLEVEQIDAIAAFRAATCSVPLTFADPTYDPGHQVQPDLPLE